MRGRVSGRVSVFSAGGGCGGLVGRGQNCVGDAAGIERGKGETYGCVIDEVRGGRIRVIVVVVVIITVVIRNMVWVLRDLEARGRDLDCEGGEGGAEARLRGDSARVGSKR